MITIILYLRIYLSNKLKKAHLSLFKAKTPCSTYNLYYASKLILRDQFTRHFSIEIIS